MAEVLDFHNFRNRKGQFITVSSDPSMLVHSKVPFMVRQKAANIVANHRKWEPPEYQARVKELQEVCPHTLCVDHYKEENKRVIEYVRVCLICRSDEDAVFGVDQRGKPLFLFEKLRTRPLLVTKIGGNFFISIFYDPLEKIVAEIFEYKERYKELAQKRKKLNKG